MENLTKKHLEALKEAVFPINFKKNREGLQKTILVREVLDVISSNVEMSNAQIAANLQELKRCEPSKEEWIDKNGKIFEWTPKGFIHNGAFRWEKTEDKVPLFYCSCPYPEKNNEQHITTCKKCGKQLLV